MAIDLKNIPITSVDVRDKFSILYKTIITDSHTNFTSKICNNIIILLYIPLKTLYYIFFSDVRVLHINNHNYIPCLI